MATLQASHGKPQSSLGKMGGRENWNNPCRRYRASECRGTLSGWGDGLLNPCGDFCEPWLAWMGLRGFRERFFYKNCLTSTFDRDRVAVVAS